MRIAICDDDRKDSELIYSTLLQYHSPGMDISCFSDSAELLEAARKDPYDIIILDIEMPAPNGYETAYRLRSYKPQPIIIFLTNSMEYTLLGYGVAFRYLTKPFSIGQLFAAMDAAVKEVLANRFVLSAEGVSHIFHMADIYYLEVFNHHIILHTIDTTYTFRSTLKEVLAQLPAGYFGIPHQSYVVNFSHVKTVTSDEIHLTNGVRIPLSRRRQKEFSAQLYTYLGR